VKKWGRSRRSPGAAGGDGDGAPGAWQAPNRREARAGVTVTMPVHVAGAWDGGRAGGGGGRRPARRKGESGVERPVRAPEEERQTRLLPPPEGRQDALVVVG
jgi:hypothetical protein